MWNKGYVSDTEYTYGYFPELSSERVKFLALINGKKVPNIGACCELGFGQGVSLLVNSAIDKAEWWGTDFNASQAASVDNMSKAAGLSTKIFADDFDHFSNRNDIPDFDYIVIHGIWSWIPEDARRSIVNFINKKLKIGGLLYLSYNSNPGWSVFSPVQKLILDYVKNELPAATLSTDAILKGLNFSERLLSQNSVFAKVNPHAQVRISKLKEHSPIYLAHEYLNECSTPMFFSEVSSNLFGTGLSFLCSSDWENNVLDLILDDEQQDFLNGIRSFPLRENAKDFLLNSFFRRDIWQRGNVSIDRFEQLNEFDRFKFIKLKNHSESELEVNSFRGKFSINNEKYLQILNCIEVGKMANGAYIRKKLNIDQSNIESFLKMIVVLLHSNLIELCVLNQEKNNEIFKLNEVFRKSNNEAQKIQYLISPLTGQCYKVGRFNQILIEYYLKGNISSKELASRLYDHLASIGQSLQKEGKKITTDAEVKNLIEKMADSFIQSEVPRLKALEIL